MAQTYCERLVESANNRKNMIAMTARGPAGVENTSYGEMLANTRSIAYRLSQEHIEFGDRVALIAENHPQWEITYLGILYRGAVAVPLDTAASIDALSAFIDDLESKLAFVSPSLASQVSGSQRLNRPPNSHGGFAFTDRSQWRCRLSGSVRRVGANARKNAEGRVIRQTRLSDI